jgi:hypothetical protein
MPERTERTEPILAPGLPAGTYLQYAGFSQAGGVREYRFRRIARGEEPREFIVSAELPLLAKHHVALQEGPALCLHVLLCHWAASGAPVPAPRTLTESDLLAHVAGRPARGKSA